VRPRSQSSAIGIREAESPLSELASQQPVFFDQVGDRLTLPAFQPAGQHQQHHLQRRGVDHEAELISRAGLKDFGRVVEQNGHTLGFWPPDALRLARCRSTIHRTALTGFSGQETRPAWN
jgi:hypothetical protein